MEDELLGATDTPTMSFALAMPGGKWAIETGEINYVDGFIHKIKIAGIETRSSGEFGITVTVHVLRGITHNTPPYRGKIDRHLYVDGRLMTAETVAEDAELEFWNLRTG